MNSIAYENLRKAQPELNLPRWVELTRTGKHRMRASEVSQITAHKLYCKMAEKVPWWRVNYRHVAPATQKGYSGRNQRAWREAMSQLRKAQRRRRELAQGCPK